MRLCRLAVCLALVLGMLSGIGTPLHAAGAATEGANGTVVFTHLLKGGGSDLWEVEPGGGGLLDVTGAIRGNESQPTWSPEGGPHIAYVASKRVDGERLQGDIWWMTPRAQKRLQLTDTPVDDEQRPSWAPGGGRLAFSRAPYSPAGNGPADIWTMTLHGTRQENRTPNTATSDDIEPAWAPDGLLIAFVSDRGGDYGIYSMTQLGKDVRKLTDRGRTPNWSPDSTRIVFERDGDIWVMSRDGTGERQLTHHVGSTLDQNPNFSPDNSLIIFNRGTAVFAMKPDGTHLRRLASGHGAAADPEFMPKCNITGTPRRDVIRGTAGPDLICYSDGGDTMYGNGGDDWIFGGTGHDIIYGGRGNDFINSGGMRATVGDVIYGGPGDDDIPASMEADRVYGGPGSDRLQGEDGNDYIDSRDGVSGNDSIDGGLGSHDVCVGDPGDHFYRCEVIRT